MPTILLNDIPLVERKQARARLGLLDAVIEKLNIKSFAEITVEELCSAAEVSRSSFFRYFHNKNEILHFHVRLWSIHATWHAEVEMKKRPGLKMIEEIFEWSAGQAAKHPRLFMEITSLRASDPEGMTRKSDSGGPMVTVAERLFRFPGKKGIEDIEEGTFFSMFKTNIEKAVSNGELPSQCDRKKILLFLTSMFYGIPLMISPRNRQLLASAYREQLDILWAGIHALELVSKGGPSG